MDSVRCECGAVMSYESVSDMIECLACGKAIPVTPNKVESVTVETPVTAEEQAEVIE